MRAIKKLMDHPSTVTSKYQLCTMLDQDARSRIFLARHLQTGEQRVCKVIQCRHVAADTRLAIDVEHSLLSGLKHPNIMKAAEIIFNPPTMEYYVFYHNYQGNNLAHIISQHAQSGKHLAEDTVWMILIQLAEFLSYLHSPEGKDLPDVGMIIHRDLVPSNVYLAENGLYLVTGFQSAAVLEPGREKASKVVGDCHYMSPEMIRKQPYTCRSDLFMLGCILYELCTLQPYRNPQATYDSILSRLQYEDNSFSLSEYSSDLCQLISSLLDPNPMKRPLAMDIVARNRTRSVYTTYRSIVEKLYSQEAAFESSNIYPSHPTQQIQQMPVPMQAQPQMPCEQPPVLRASTGTSYYTTASQQTPYSQPSEIMTSLEMGYPPPGPFPPQQPMFNMATAPVIINQDTSSPKYHTPLEAYQPIPNHMNRYNTMMRPVVHESYPEYNPANGFATTQQLPCYPYTSPNQFSMYGGPCIVRQEFRPLVAPQQIGDISSINTISIYEGSQRPSSQGLRALRDASVQSSGRPSREGWSGPTFGVDTAVGTIGSRTPSPYCRTPSRSHSRSIAHRSVPEYDGEAPSVSLADAEYTPALAFRAATTRTRSRSTSAKKELRARSRGR